MTHLSLIAAALILLCPSLMWGQDSTHRRQRGGPIDTTRIGVMSPMVVQQRLQQLGYTNVTLVESTRVSVRANASKGGRPMAVRLDPHSGKVIAVPGRMERGRDGLRLIRPDGSIAAPPQPEGGAPARP